MTIGRWQIQYLGTMIGDFDTGWRMTFRRRDFHRLGGNVIAILGPFQFIRAGR